MAQVTIKKTDNGFCALSGGRMLTPSDDLTEKEVAFFVAKGTVPVTYEVRKAKEEEAKKQEESKEDDSEFTVAEIKEKLDELGIEYAKSLKKKELLQLLADAMKAQDEDEDEEGDEEGEGGKDNKGSKA